MQKRTILLALILSPITINSCCFNHDFDTNETTRSELFRPANFPEQEFIPANKGYQFYRKTGNENGNKIARANLEYQKCVARNLQAINTKLNEDNRIDAPQDDCLTTLFFKLDALKKANSTLLDYEKNNPRFNPNALLPEEEALPVQEKTN